MRFKKLYTYIIVAILTFNCISCNSSNQKSEINNKVITQIDINAQSKFDNFINQIFINEISSNTLNLHFTILNPDNYNINTENVSLGTISIDVLKKGLLTCENYIAALETFDYDKLSNEQQLIYDIFKSYFSIEENAEDLLIYNEVLTPTSGVHVVYPILFSEYTFKNKADVEQYLKLISLMYTYFLDIVEFEKTKSEFGLFMSDKNADTIINQCQEFISDIENNFLITIFNEKIENLIEINDDEKEAFKTKNKEFFNSYIIPAYQLLIDELTNLKGTGINEAGLYYFQNGKEFYKNLCYQKTGSSKSVEEMITTLDKYIYSCFVTIASINAKNSQAFDEALITKFQIQEPNEIMEYLKNVSKKYYPEIENVNYKIKYINECLEDNMSPAFYLTPPIDDNNTNIIYINNSISKDYLFTNLAHEGYPGHLYQNVYFNKQKPNPIRSILNFLGYSEGWASYVELNSYYLAGFDNDVATILSNYQSALLCIYARIDIGIHYEGWQTKDLEKYLNSVGITPNINVINNIFSTIVADPADHLSYAIGYLEITELREKAKKMLGENFNLKEFHKFLLDIGPAPFDIIDKYMNKWISSL